MLHSDPNSRIRVNDLVQELEKLQRELILNNDFSSLQAIMTEFQTPADWHGTFLEEQEKDIP